MQLYLCRHGEAVDTSAALSDETRWLTRAGRQDVALVGGILRGQGDAPQVILTSPFVRAVQTASELAHATGYEREMGVLPALAPEGQLSQVLSALADLPPDASVFLVGHEPQMSEWSAALLGRPSFGRSFQKAAVLRLNFDGLPETGTGRAVFYLSPQQLRPTPV